MCGLGSPRHPTSRPYYGTWVGSFGGPGLQALRNELVGCTRRAGCVLRRSTSGPGVPQGAALRKLSSSRPARTRLLSSFGHSCTSEALEAISRGGSEGQPRRGGQANRSRQICPAASGGPAAARHAPPPAGPPPQPDRGLAERAPSAETSPNQPSACQSGGVNRSRTVVVATPLLKMRVVVTRSRRAPPCAPSSILANDSSVRTAMAFSMDCKNCKTRALYEKLASACGVVRSPDTASH